MAKSEPKWKLVQRVVALLEKALTPEAEVLHDQMLPDITTGNERQCDVVVKYGKPPRQNIAIVEVQDRSSKVKIGTLGEWWHKMHAVGAQRLICVSALDYPKSVMDEVEKKLGPSVTLVTLKELATEEWPIPLGMNGLSVRVPEAKVPEGKPYGVLYGPGPLGPNSQVPSSEMRIFRNGDTASVSISELIVDHFDRVGPLQLERGDHEMNLDINIGRALWAEYKGVRQAIRKLVVPLVVTIHEVTLPMAMASYEQIGHDGSLAWALSADGVINDEQVQFRMILVPDGQGRFGLRGFEVIGAPRGGYFWIPT